MSDNRKRATHVRPSARTTRRKQDWSNSVIGTHASGASGAQPTRRRAQASRNRNRAARRARAAEGHAAQVSQIHFNTRSIDERTARHRVGASRTETFMRHRNAMGRVWLVLAIVAVLAIALGLGTCAFRNSISSSLALDDASVESALVEPASADDVQYILLAGIGSDRGNETASFAAVMRVDSQNKAISVLNIPTAIAESYADAEDGQNMLRDAPSAANEGELVTRVSELLDQDINHYVRITEEGFVSLVDALGGITVNVEQNVDDPAAGTSVLYPGEQVLSGKQALTYVSAKNYSDTFATRAEAQTQVLSALIEAVEEKGGISFAMSADAVAGSINTDMTYDELNAIAEFYPEASFEVGTVPGSVSVSGNDRFWSVSSSKWDTVCEAFKSGGSMDTSIDTSGVDKGSLSIIILNGAGSDGFSAQAAAVLENAGYTIQETGNAESFVYDETLVIYRDSDDAVAAEAIVEDLGIGRTVSAGVYYSLSTDIQVVVGKDWTGGNV